MSEISVIVPVYKVEPYLCRCVDSILAQTFVDFELILVDDGSPDNCGVICDEYAQKDARVHVIHQENGGLSAARNAGIDWVFAHSNSEWITFVDSDDWVHPQMLESMYFALQGSHAKICICNHVSISAYVSMERYEEFQSRVVSPEAFYVENEERATVACAKLYRKSIWESLRFPRGKLHEDVYITHEALFSELQIVVIDTPLYMYYSNPNSITNTPSVKRVKDMQEGRKFRIRFFIEHGFEKAYQYEIHATSFLATEWNAMQLGLIPEDQAYRRELSRRFRKAIRREHISFKKQIWVYECAYPHLMKGYWILVALGKKLGIKGRSS